MQKLNILNQLIESKLVAVVRGDTAEEAIDIAEAAIDGGFGAIEITYTVPNAEQVMKALQGNSRAVIGSGTVLDPETARHAILNGAQFIVSPHFNREIAKLCNRYSVPYLPGCMTVKEIITALESGSDVVKLFPSNHFSPSFIKSVHGPLPEVRIMPTGGVSLDNVKDWIDGGAVAVGIGSDLNRAYARGGKEAVQQLCSTYKETVKGGAK